MAALLQTDEPENGGFDGLSNCEETVVLEQSCLLIPKCFSNMFPFCFSEDDTVELLVDDVIL